MKLTALPLLLAAACGAPVEMHDVVYDARHGKAGTLDLYLPDDDGRAHATVLFIHGGSWVGGDKNHFQFAGPRLARSGFAVASIDYRLLPDGQFPNDAEDAMCSLAYLRNHADEYGIDRDRIVVWGYSAGAHLASLVGIAADDPALASDCDEAGGMPQARPAAVIAASGPQDMVKLFHQLGAADTMVKLFGGTPDEVPDAYALGSPITHVAPGAPPYLLLRDSFDIGGIAEFRTAMVDAGNEATMLEVDGSLHVLEQGDDAGEYEVGVSQETPEGWLAVEDFLFDTVGAP